MDVRGTTSIERPELTSQQLLDRITRALKKDGDFPTSARIVGDLRRLANDPRTTANQVTEIILREPSLGIRILHLVNSTFYRRSTQIMTISQAVVRIGMKQLSELCAGLVLLQKFVPNARKDGVFAACLRKAIITPLLASDIAAEMQPNNHDRKNESGYLAGMFAELGTLLLAYYFPQIYENALKRADQKHQDVAQSIKEITGLTSLDISIAVLKALELPDYYIRVLMHAQNGGAKESIPGLPHEQKAIQQASHAVFAASQISTVIVENKSKAALDNTLEKIRDRVPIDIKGLEKVVGHLPETFKEHCETIEISLPEIPAFVAQYAEDKALLDEHNAGADSNDPFSRYIDEIRDAVESREPTASIITTVMETLAWGLQFQRVFLLLIEPGRKNLRGRMLLGERVNFDPKEFVRPLGVEAGPYAPDNQAVQSGRLIFQGEPLLQNGWPFVTLPIGFAQRCIGVIYADKIGSSALELDPREQAAVGVLAELLDRSITLQTR